MTRYYKVTIETEPIPPASWSAAVDGVLERLETLPELEGLIAWGTAPDTIGMVFDIEAQDAAEASDIGRGVFLEAIRDLRSDAVFSIAFGFSEPSLRRLEAAPSDGDDAGEPTLLGATDAAQLVGLTRQRIYQLLDEDEAFPRPTTSTARGQLWDRTALLLWHAARNRSAYEILAERAKALTDMGAPAGMPFKASR